MEPVIAMELLELNGKLVDLRVENKAFKKRNEELKKQLETALYNIQYLKTSLSDVLEGQR